MKPTRHSSLRDPQRVCTLYLVRHGQSEASRAEILGQPDSPLTTLGRSQARQIARAFQPLPIAAIFASDFLRARQTAEMIARPHRLPVQIAPALRERSFGRLEGAATPTARAEVQRLRHAYERLSKDERWHVKLLEDMESDEEALSRLLPCLHQIAQTYRGRTVVCAGHANILKILLVQVGFATWAELPPGSIAPTGYVQFLMDGEVFEVVATQGVHKHTRACPRSTARAKGHSRPLRPPA